MREATLSLIKNQLAGNALSLTYSYLGVRNKILFPRLPQLKIAGTTNKRARRTKARFAIKTCRRKQ
jgi:hypothetical protein